MSNIWSASRDSASATAAGLGPVVSYMKSLWLSIVPGIVMVKNWLSLVPLRTSTSLS
ncbi:hypothetical protein ACIG87_31415 [Micromonospora sp. NPDC051925]|uniref:hypothetical protein n=1 Tax=Micromonospora sp. NPDC051925 TaxID=3364288 RepID=UPI0037CA3317